MTGWASCFTRGLSLTSLTGNSIAAVHWFPCVNPGGQRRRLSRRSSCRRPFGWNCRDPRPGRGRSVAGLPVAGVEQPAQRDQPLSRRRGPRPRRRRGRSPGESASVGAPGRAVRRRLVQLGEGLEHCLGLRRGPGRRSGRPGCRRPSRTPSSGSMIAEVEVCRPRPVTSLTTPVRRPADGTSRLTRVDLPTPVWPTRTVTRPVSRSRSSSAPRAAVDRRP